LEFFKHLLFRSQWHTKLRSELQAQKTSQIAAEAATAIALLTIIVHGAQ
jgi:hypothetical protein